jgi:hypothetical protein
MPKSLAEGRNKIKQCMDHPLLPTLVRSALSDYITAIEFAIVNLPQILTECAGEMLYRYPDLKSIGTIRDGESAEVWILNRINRAMTERNPNWRLKPHADKVLISIRDYLQVDNVMRG